MRISLFTSVKGKVKGQPCMWAALLSLIESPELQALAEKIAQGHLELKTKLPAVTWQAFFPDGERKNDKAQPSGLFMLDIDHVDAPDELWHRIEGRRQELGIRIAHKTISTHGLRLVAECRPDFGSLEENQRWLAGEIGVEFDAVCKDWARASFLVPRSYFYLLDERVFHPAVEAPYVLVNDGTKPTRAVSTKPVPRVPATAAPMPATAAPTAAKMQTHFHGIALKDIALAWLNSHGGVPEEGERNATLYKLALRMRYITDFNPNAIAQAMPECGLSEAEVRQLCANACSTQRSGDMPHDMAEVLRQLEHDAEAEREGTTEEVMVDAPIDFVLPPVFRQYYDIAPSDFKHPAVLCLLPVLGTLGSKLRARYINGRLESPSFSVALQGEQASGKSFIESMSARCLKPLLEKDEEERAKERAYEDKMKLARLVSKGGTKQERMDLKKDLEERPQPIIRKIPATASMTKLLMRMENAQGLHLFALAVEIDTVTKAFKKGFSDLSDLLRCAHDNSEYGQDYASDSSFSGSVHVYYNTLYSGTPNAIRRFYSDSENGTMGRTLFVSIPDQFGKKMPLWREMTKEENAIVDMNLVKLYEVSIEGDEVKEEHEMDMGFLNERLEEWLEKQRQLSLKSGDRVRNAFYRRCAEISFRAGMVAYYLWDENESASVKNNVAKFALWVAEMMLQQFLVRVSRDEFGQEKVLSCNPVYYALPQEFSRDLLAQKLAEYGYQTPVRSVLAVWKRQHLIESDKRYGATNFRKTH